MLDNTTVAAPDAAPSNPIDQLRQLTMQIGALAQSVPEAQQELRAAASALTAAQLKLTASQQQPQPTQAMVGA